MTMDTINANSIIASKKTVEAFQLSECGGTGLFNVYLEFILYWTRTDEECYRTALMKAAGREVNDFLQTMLGRKRKMIDVFGAHRENGEIAWFESAFGNGARSMENTGNDRERRLNLIDAFHFAYRKEYESLKLFEKAGRSNLDAAIRSLLENAVELQRRHILYLDDSFFSINTVARATINSFNTETMGERWALTKPSG